MPDSLDRLRDHQPWSPSRPTGSHGPRPQRAPSIQCVLGQKSPRAPLDWSFPSRSSSSEDRKRAGKSAARQAITPISLTVCMGVRSQPGPIALPPFPTVLSLPGRGAHVVELQRQGYDLHGTEGGYSVMIGQTKRGFSAGRMSPPQPVWGRRGQRSCSQIPGRTGTATGAVKQVQNGQPFLEEQPMGATLLQLLPCVPLARQNEQPISMTTPWLVKFSARLLCSGS